MQNYYLLDTHVDYLWTHHKHRCINQLDTYYMNWYIIPRWIMMNCPSIVPFKSHDMMKKIKGMWKLRPTADGWNPANQLRLVVYPIIYKVLYIPGGCLGFLPSTVVSIYSWWPSYEMRYCHSPSPIASRKHKQLNINHLGILQVTVCTKPFGVSISWKTSWPDS